MDESSAISLGTANLQWLADFLGSSDPVSVTSKYYDDLTNTYHLDGTLGTATGYRILVRFAVPSGMGPRQPTFTVSLYAP